jgi:DNA-binding PadR family transcriptional regulator
MRKIDQDMGEDKFSKLVEVLLEERKQKSLYGKNEKLKQILLLLAGGAALTTMILAPGTARLFRNLNNKDKDWKEWKEFNSVYLRRTLQKLESQKFIEVSEKNGVGKVILTENGRKKLMEMSVNDISIHKPVRWDGKWRMVFYDVTKDRNSVRDRFRSYLKAAGFYLWQKSVYLHAYPCEKEIEFLRNFLGIAGEVRLVVANKIENDQPFRDYFGV